MVEPQETVSHDILKFISIQNSKKTQNVRETNMKQMIIILKVNDLNIPITIEESICNKSNITTQVD